MMIQFYMDENVPRQITVGLRLRGVDVLTVQEDGKAGMLDPDVLARAAALGRVLFTQDDDFLGITSERLQAGQNFGGVVYAHQRMTSIGDCVRDLEMIANACDLADFANHVEFLPL